MLRISKLTDYGIVLLTHIAAEPADSVLTARSLVERSKLPLPTIGKTLKMLCRAGILVSHRGVGGGYSLARPATEISIADVIAAIEGPIALTECNAAAPDLCVLEPYCPVRSNWMKINRVVSLALQQLSIADMSTPLSDRSIEGRVLSLVQGGRT